MNSGAVERQLGKTLVDVVRELDLRELHLGPPLQLAALEDAGHLTGDRAQEVDVARVELPPLGALHVQHADQPRPRLDGHGGHRVEPVLVETRHPLPVRLLAHVGHHRRAPRVGHPSRNPLADPHRHLADHVLVQAVGRGKQQLAAGQEIERAHVDPDGRGRLADDQLEELVRPLGGRGCLGQTNQEVELACGKAGV